MPASLPTGVMTLDAAQAPLESVFTVAPLFIVGTRSADGGHNLAPKHLAGPLTFDGFFGFTCTREHASYRNIERERAFTVSFPTPTQVVLTSLAASPRIGEEGDKPALDAIPTFPAQQVDGVLVDDAYLYMECEVDRLVDLGRNVLVLGKVLLTHVRETSLRASERDDQELIYRHPLLVYLHPGRYASVQETNSFPYPLGMRR